MKTAEKSTDADAIYVQERSSRRRDFNIVATQNT